MSKDFQEISDFLPADFLDSPYVRLQYDRYGDDSLTAPAAPTAPICLDAHPSARFDLGFTLFPPRYFSSPGSLASWLSELAHTKKALLDTLSALSLYEAALVQRYQELITAVTFPAVRLLRESGTPVTYLLEVGTVYIDDGSRFVCSRRRSFTGRQRTDALQAVRDFMDAHPNARSHIDIVPPKRSR